MFRGDIRAPDFIKLPNRGPRPRKPPMKKQDCVYDEHGEANGRRETCRYYMGSWLKKLLLGFA